MKKIDLHTHTVPTESDSFFEFELSKLVEYVDKLKIDALAITNHNTFDLKQYNKIRRSLEIVVFPGIEINLDNGHILIISSAEEFEIIDFNEKCKVISSYIKEPSDSITTNQLKKVFNDLSKYILIPHYDKSPKIKYETIQDLKEYITAGEVSSVSKFKRLLKKEKDLTPVLFSDIRFSADLKVFPTRQTFVDLKDITLAGIKSCLIDKSKISLSKESGNDFFQVTDDGLELSTGLNIILGERSSGKTVTLNKIANTSGNAKYIKQFSLLQDDEKAFNDSNNSRLNNINKEYLAVFKSVVDDISQIDIKLNNTSLENYVETLKRHASESEQKDAYSKSNLFNEELFNIEDSKSIDTIIDSVSILIENTEYQKIISKYIQPEELKKLLAEILNEAIRINIKREQKKWLNSIISNIQHELRIKTTNTFIENVNFYDIALDNIKVKAFHKIVSNIKNARDINKVELGKFSIITFTKPIENATDLNKIGIKKRLYSNAFKLYNNPYNYLQALREIGIEDSELYKFYVKIESKTLNNDGFEVSGGERSEFNLIHEIKDATTYDMLLIDEPESSFDNVFLKQEINTLIKDMSQLMPVVVVTHNSTVGASIKPNYIAITQKSIEDGKFIYRVFTGYPSDKELISSDGIRIKNYDAILNCLEAGEEAYTERKKQTYEILKDRK